MKAIRVIASVVLVAHLALVSGQRIVLCAGADGHVAFESAGADLSCSPCAPAEGCTGSESSAGSSGGCVDLLVHADAKGVRLFQKERVEVHPLLFTAPDDAPAATIQSFREGPDDPAIVKISSTTLRSTVLLI